MTSSIEAWNLRYALERARLPGDIDELDAIARYVWNMAVCGHLYPVLHAVEITFRNQLHNALTTRYGSTWYDTVGFLTADELTMIASAKTISV